MAHTTFADLPPEMVGIVFAFVRSKAHRGAVCLVSRAMRDHMRPLLWEKLEIMLGTASPSSLATLVHPRSGITGHIRELDVLDPDESAEVEDRLRLLISAIPRDRLRDFECVFEIKTLTLQLLLQSQRKLETLEVYTPFTTAGRPERSGLDSNEHYAWMNSSLSDIKSMALFITGRSVSNKRIFESMKSVFENHSKISDLLLRSISPTMNRVITLRGLLRHAKDFPLFSNLTRLRLVDLRIGKTGDQPILESLNLAKLEVLQLEGCHSIVSFVDALTSYYTPGVGDLDSIYIVLPVQTREPIKTVKAIEKLLKACPKLEALQLQLSGHGYIAKECVLLHHEKLKWLMVGAGKSQSRTFFSLADMTAILRTCCRLEYLATDLPTVDLGSITKLGTAFHPEGEFADMLAVISTHPRLCALRIFNLPTVEFDNVSAGETVPANRHVYFCQTLMQNFANQIFQFMADRGSNLKVLSIKSGTPDVRPNGQELDFDANGHRWPGYHYVRRRFADVTGMKGVVAHPFKLVDVLLDFPDTSFILHYNE